MSLSSGLQTLLENEETQSVGTSFGGSGGSRGFSVPQIRNWIIAQAPFVGGETVDDALRQLYGSVPRTTFISIIGSLIRFSFVIELTDLRVGSTKMKTRWVPGFILMPQIGSFEPVRGSFEPGNDPRAASYGDCLAIFERCCRLVCDQVRADPDTIRLLTQLATWRRVPYEFPLGYADPSQDPVHQPGNVRWLVGDDIRWLVEARRILGNIQEPHNTAIARIESSKLEVKGYKTDRSLTGKDKTNRAKRWEVLAGDFQHATLSECWSVERKLTCDLICFEGFPESVKEFFSQHALIVASADVTRCPVTLSPLNYPSFAESVLAARHGRSDYQIGHLTPLKRGGRHIGANVCWQSADGNRIQGDLTLEETQVLLDGIVRRRIELNPR